MGSGVHASQGYAKAAYVRDIWTWPVDSFGYQLYQDVNGDRYSQATDSSCYSKTVLTTFSSYPWNEFYYGGPGKTTTSCNY
jgi:hypothetical protein